MSVTLFPFPRHSVRAFVACAALVGMFIPAAPASAAARVEGIQYLSPRPGADMVSPRQAVTIRPGAPLDASTLSAARLAVVGAASGPHSGTWTLALDGRTAIFTPDRPFAPGERVQVSLSAGLRAADGTAVAPFSYAFTVSRMDPSRRPARSPWPELEAAAAEAPPAPGKPPLFAPSSSPCDTLPPTYPPFTVSVNDDPAPGSAFFAPVVFSVPTGDMVILDDLGNPVFHRRTAGRVFDFKVLPNGYISYYENGWFYWMDANYAVVDSFTCQNGYDTDLHDLILLQNGNVLLMSYDPQPVGMDTVVAGGNPNAIVTGLVLQELDAADNVVFQWRSWDHFDITDASVSGTLSLTDSLIDYVHGNAFAEDVNGDILISSRHMNEITKIDRQTGNVIWRFGQNAVHNDFTVIGDSRGFSHQHDIRILPNGNLTVYDNGNYLSPQYSRGIEYAVNEQTMSMFRVWQYFDNPAFYAPFMGNVQRLPNGNSMIGWGGGPAIKITEVKPGGAKAFEITMAANAYTYRAFRYPWRTTLFTAGADTLDFGPVVENTTATLPLVVTNHGSEPLDLTCFVSLDSTFTVLDAPPVTIAPGDSATLTVEYAPPAVADNQGLVYLRSVSTNRLVAQTVVLRGSGASATGIGGGTDRPLRPILFANRPNPFSPATRISFELPEAGRAVVRVFDLSGRLVRTLLDGDRPAGRHEADWDGRDDAGRDVGSGVFFYSLETAGGREARRMVRVR